MSEIMLQEMTLQEMKETNGGCCSRRTKFVKYYKHCFKPSKPNPCNPKPVDPTPPGTGESY